VSTLPEILKHLRQHRLSLRAELDRIDEAIAILNPPPVITTRAARQQSYDRILNAGITEWATAREIAHRAGIDYHNIGRVLLRLVSRGEMEQQRFNHVNHFRLRRHELRIVAGDGVVA